MAPQGVLQSNKSINSDVNKVLTTLRCRLSTLITSVITKITVETIHLIVAV